VHGIYTYKVSDNDNITLFEAKERCVKLAQNVALRDAFGQSVVNEVMESNIDINGELTSSFVENSRVTARGEWLADKKEPQISVAYHDGNLYFTAEVWGEAREIRGAKIDFSWEVLKDVGGNKVPTREFNSDDRAFIRFRTPSKGFVAVYVFVGDGKVRCILPYPNDSDGTYPVKAGVEYKFFDREFDATAPRYRMSTDKPLEFNRFVMIYSPNSFVKCNDMTGESGRPNTVSEREFFKWLSNCRSLDKDMNIDEKWVKIYNQKAEQNQ
jgi:hypothetical protein